MALRTQVHNRQLHAILNKQGIDAEAKAELVLDFTNGRTHRSSQMTDEECLNLIRSLNAPVRDELDKKRKRVISHLKGAGYILGDGRADMTAINQWVQKQKFKKPLNKHTSSELSTLIYAAEQVLDLYLKQYEGL